MQKSNYHSYAIGFCMLLIFVIFCGFGTDNQYQSQCLQTPVSNEMKRIYYSEDKSMCYTLAAYRLSCSVNGFEDAKTHIENGTFYHIDDVHEILTLERKRSSDEIEISVRIWKHITETRITLLSCPEHLKTNKAELNKLVDSLKTKNN